jgi:hypothetical protein
MVVADSPLSLMRRARAIFSGGQRLWATDGPPAVDSGEFKQADVDESVLRVAGFKGKSPHCGG